MKMFFQRLSSFLIVTSIFAAIVWIFGREFRIFSPLSTWAPSVRIMLAERGTPGGDSIIVANLERKIEIYSRKGYDKREFKSRKQLLDFYIERGDTLSVSYAIAKVECLSSGDGFMRYSSEVLDAKEILWEAWQSNQLDDNGKGTLWTAIFMLTNDLPVRSSEQYILEALNVSESMSSDYPAREQLRTVAIMQLFGACCTDMNRWADAERYISMLDRSSLDLDFMKEQYWLIRGNFFLLQHNINGARSCLDSALAVDCRMQELVESVIDLKRAIYDAEGKTEAADRERKHLAALHRTTEPNSLRTYVNAQNAIHKGRKLAAQYYLLRYYNSIAQTTQAQEELDTITPIQEMAYCKNVNLRNLLSIDYCLNFDEEPDMVPTFIKGLERQPYVRYLNPEQQLQIIEYRIRYALIQPSDSSAPMIDRGLNDLRKRLQAGFTHFTDGQKAAFWKAEEPVMRGIFGSDYSAQKYDAALISKGILLESSNSVRRAILESGDSMLIADWKRLQSFRQSEALNITVGSQDNKADAAPQEVRHIADSLDHSIAARSAAYMHSTNSWDIRWTDVQNALADDECAIEYICYSLPSSNRTAPDTLYAALVLTKSMNKPLCVTLCHQYEIHTGAAAAAKMYQPGADLYRLLWKPLEPHLPSGNIYVSMDGKLHHVNLEALPISDTQLLSDRYAIRRVSSTRNLALCDKAALHSGALYGGIAYDSDASESVAAQSAATAAIERSLIWRQDKKRKRVPTLLSPLPNTLSEVQDIKHLLLANGDTAELYSDKRANEQSLYDLSGTDISLLHIATHGIFISADDADEGDPMRRWGLCFAGANNFLAEPDKQLPGYCDGIATAAEIATLDLRHTDLVVLSACKTAGGDVTSDGVFGLQRAFKQAGVNSIVMSLWDVDDQSTATFMTYFYEEMLQSGSKRQAFNNARSRLRSRYSHPIDWAAFILLD